MSICCCHEYPSSCFLTQVYRLSSCYSALRCNSLWKTLASFPLVDGCCLEDHCRSAAYVPADCLDSIVLTCISRSESQRCRMRGARACIMTTLHQLVLFLYICSDVASERAAKGKTGRRNNSSSSSKNANATAAINASVPQVTDLCC